MKLLRQLQEEYLHDPKVVHQLIQEFGDYAELEKEFHEMWDTHILEVINESSLGNGHIAGAGAVDYNESKVLYFYIRTIKPKNILEIGHASGCSTVVLAKALEANNTGGKVYTCDIKGNSVEKPYKNFISSFETYMENGLIEATAYVDAIDYVEQLEVNNIDFIFVDASHESEFCDPMASLLREKYPSTLITYHEWAMSPLATREEFSYVSLPQNLQHQQMAERQSFLNNFPANLYSHYGFFGSCGLGVVRPL